MKSFTALASTLLFLVSCSPHEKIEPVVLPEEASFAFHLGVLTNEVNITTAEVCLLSGETDRDYDLLVQLDGESFLPDDSRMNFDESPISSFQIPDLLPGEHELSVTLSLDGESVSETIPFTEPLRIKEFNLLMYKSDGKLYLKCPQNPYGFRMSVRDSMYVEGKCYYTVCTTDGLTETRTGVISDSRVSIIPEFAPSDGKISFLMDVDAVEREITSQSEANYGWSAVWNHADEGFWEYREEFKSWSYYKVARSEQHVTLSVDGYEGTTVTVFCALGNVYLNGEEIKNQSIFFVL